LEDYRAHLTEKNRALEEKQKDNIICAEKTMDVALLDLQSVLQLPMEQLVSCNLLQM